MGNMMDIAKLAGKMYINERGITGAAEDAGKVIQGIGKLAKNTNKFLKTDKGQKVVKGVGNLTKYGVDRLKEDDECREIIDGISNFTKKGIDIFWGNDKKDGRKR